MTTTTNTPSFMAPVTKGTISQAGLQKSILVLFRLSLGWTFLYAGFNQVLNPNWTSARFLSGAKTFKAMYAWFGSPEVVPYIDFMVQWGHLLIGIALILGICVRLSAGFGALMMMLYYIPRLDFPMVGAHNFIVEYHLVYALILVYLGLMKAGQVAGIENRVARIPPVAALLDKYPNLRPWMS